MIADSLYAEVEWHFKHYAELKSAPENLLVEIDGKQVCYPAAWVSVINQTYRLHKGLISRAMKLRYEENKTAETISGLLGIYRGMFYEWRKEFLQDALYFAVQNFLVSLPEKVSDKNSKKV